MKSFAELTEDERLAFATHSLLINNRDGIIRHSRLGVEITFETFDQVIEWYFDWRNGGEPTELG